MSRRIPLTRGLFAIVDDDDYDDLSRYKWQADPSVDTHYAVRHATVVIGEPRIKIRMHRVITCAPDGMEVDHINHDGLDNRRCNLRVVTKQENQRNRVIGPNNKSGYKGVHKVKHGTKTGRQWRAQVGKIFLGDFATPEEAHEMYERSIGVVFGKFSRVNFNSGEKDE